MISIAEKLYNTYSDVNFNMTSSHKKYRKEIDRSYNISRVLSFDCKNEMVRIDMTYLFKNKLYFREGERIFFSNKDKIKS